MFSIPQFIEYLENQGATRGEVEGGKTARVMIQGVWQTVGAPMTREAIEGALLENLSVAHKRELEGSEGRFWFRCERPLGAWMVCVQWKSPSSRPARRMTLISQAASMSDPIEAAETAGLTSQAASQVFKSAAPSVSGLVNKADAAPRNLEQMRGATRQNPAVPPPLAPQPSSIAAPWENETTGSVPPPLPSSVGGNGQESQLSRAPQTASWETFRLTLIVGRLA